MIPVKNTSKAVLFTAFTSTVVLMLIIFVISFHFDVTLLDGVSEATKVEELLNKILQDPLRTRVHIWITATLDVAFPLSYGFFLSGIAMSFFQKQGFYVAIPALLAVVFDLFEGVIQLLALTETLNVIYLKAFVTPLKFGFVFIAVIIAIAGFLKTKKKN